MEATHATEKSKPPPRFTPGIVASAIFGSTGLLDFVPSLSLPESAMFTVSWTILAVFFISLLVVSCYETFCIRRLSQKIAFKNAPLRMVDRIVSYLVLPFANPLGLVLCSGLWLLLAAQEVALILGLYLTGHTSQSANASMVYTIVASIVISITLLLLPPALVTMLFYRNILKITQTNEKFKCANFWTTRKPAISLTATILIPALIGFFAALQEPKSYLYGIWFLASGAAMAVFFVQLKRLSHSA
jgi:hypothetical protein